MDERLQFVARRLAGEPMTDLCREFVISRKTGYKSSAATSTAGWRVLRTASRGLTVMPSSPFQYPPGVGPGAARGRVASEPPSSFRLLLRAVSPYDDPSGASGPRGELLMSKGMDQKKENKKKPAKSFDEKRAAKREKRRTKGR